MGEGAAALLRAYGLHPRKDLGQNFLGDPAILGRLVAAADLTPDDTVIEVGPGLGHLTRLLAERAGRVLAVELDGRLIPILRERLADLPNVEIIHGDILQFSIHNSQFTIHKAQPPNLPIYQSTKVVGNLPYYLTSAILRHFLEHEPRPCLMVVTVQREVAERIVAGPGAMSLLAVSVQFYSRPRIVARIKAGAFYPRPQVDSAVVRLDVAARPTVALPEGVDEAAFFRLVRAGFSQKRKTLRNALSAGLGIEPARAAEMLTRAGIDPRRRAETLGLAEWARLSGEVLPENVE